MDEWLSTNLSNLSGLLWWVFGIAIALFALYVIWKFFWMWLLFRSFDPYRKLSEQEISKEIQRLQQELKQAQLSYGSTICAYEKTHIDGREIDDGIRFGGTVDGKLMPGPPTLSELRELEKSVEKLKAKLNLAKIHQSHIQLREKVEFAAYAPQAIAAGSNFVLDVWAYTASQFDTLRERIHQIGRDANLGRKSGIEIARGSVVNIAIEIEGLVVPDPQDFLIWDGEPTNTSFVIQVPRYAVGGYMGKALISCAGMTVFKLVFQIEILARGKNWELRTEEKTKDPLWFNSYWYPTSAFASYASEDRDEVLARIQGMKKISPNLDVFVDVLSLRSGEHWQEKLEQHVPNKDTFYLFWSTHAAESKWVNREWNLALIHRGLEYIDPVPLEEPDIAPPPQELKCLHFSDAYLAYIAHERAKKQV